MRRVVERHQVQNHGDFVSSRTSYCCGGAFGPFRGPMQFYHFTPHQLKVHALPSNQHPIQILADQILLGVGLGLLSGRVHRVEARGVEPGQPEAVVVVDVLQADHIAFVGHDLTQQALPPETPRE